MTDNDAIRALNHLFAQPRTLEAQIAWRHVQERLHELVVIESQYAPPSPLSHEEVAE